VPINSSYQKTVSITLDHLNDTVFGIENEELIPIRHTDLAPEVPVSIDRLYDPSPLNIGTESWQVIILVIAVFLFGIAKSFSNNRFRLGLKALVNYSVAKAITREEQVFFHRSNILLTISYTLILSLFVYQINRMILSLTTVPVGFKSFLIILVGVVLVYLIKYIFSRLFLFVFNEMDSAPEYIFNISLYNNLLGALLIPILCIAYFTLVPFSEVFIYLALPLVFLVFLLRLIRLFRIGTLRGVLYVYIFLYICSFEILPLVVLYRLFI